MPTDQFLSWFHALYLLVRENDEKALFLLLLIEESGVPLPFVPGDVLIMIAGYRASMGQMGVWEGAMAVIPAVMLGSTILYSLSHRFGRRLLLRFGKYIHINQSRLDKMERWIQQHGPVMVLVGRLTPGLRTPTSVISGVFRVPFPQFLFFTTLSAIIWSVFWLGLGYYSGRTLIPLVRRHHGTASLAILGSLVLLVLAGLMAYRWRRKRSRMAHQERHDKGAEGQVATLDR